jgi:rsbT co-antagonist protein RsbR
MKTPISKLPAILEAEGQRLLDEWLACQQREGVLQSGRLDESELADQARRFLMELRGAIGSATAENISAPGWAATRDILDSVARERANLGFTPSETATIVFSLKEPLFNLLRQDVSDPDALARETWAATVLIDKLGLYTTEAYQKGRENIIARQQQEMLELSTPVIELWAGVLALPLIGTLDSERAQIVMETLLERIVSSEAEIAIIDITGVPTVDTLVAQHLIKTVSAARLMGADCIISGIRPQIAQTIVHLGLELDVGRFRPGPAPPRQDGGRQGEAGVERLAANGRNPNPADRRLPARVDSDRHARPARPRAAGRSNQSHR